MYRSLRGWLLCGFNFVLIRFFQQVYLRDCGDLYSNCWNSDGGVGLCVDGGLLSEGGAGDQQHSEHRQAAETEKYDRLCERVFAACGAESGSNRGYHYGSFAEYHKPSDEGVP
jgi:hypothetical protein